MMKTRASSMMAAVAVALVMVGNVAALGVAAAATGPATAESDTCPTEYGIDYWAICFVIAACNTVVPSQYRSWVCPPGP